MAKPKSCLKFKQAKKPEVMTDEDWKELESIQREMWVGEEPPWVATDTRKDIGRVRNFTPTQINSLIGIVETQMFFISLKLIRRKFI